MFHFKGILPHCATAEESICTYSSFCVLFHLITLAGYILLCCCCRQWLHSSLLFLKLELLCSYSSPLLLSLSLLLFCSRPSVLPCHSQIIKYSSPPSVPLSSPFRSSPLHHDPISIPILYKIKNEYNLKDEKTYRSHIHTYPDSTSKRRCAIQEKLKAKWELGRESRSSKMVVIPY